MSESILDSIKPLVGIQPTDTAFDTSLIIHINSVFMILNQLGVGTDSVFSIADNTETWDLFLLSGDETYLSLTKSYMALKVQSIFDPPTSGIVANALERTIQEMESRLVTQTEIRPTV